MGRERHAPGASPLAIIIVPIGVVCVAASGALYALAGAFNPWGVLNPLALVGATLVFCPCLIQTVRLGVVRGGWLAFILSTLGTSSFIAGAMVACAAYRGAVDDVLGFHAQRMEEGVALFGGAWKVRAGWLVACWVLGALWVWFWASAVCHVEAARPYCRSCAGWANRKRWTLDIPAPDKPALAGVPGETIGGLLALGAGSPASGKVLRTVIRSCRCGRVASASADVRKPDEWSGDTVVHDVRLGAGALRAVAEWGQRVAPGRAPPLPRLEALEETAPREAFDILAIEAPLEKNTVRLDKSLGASDLYADNGATKALRARLARGDWRSAEEAIAAPMPEEDRAAVVEACADWPGRPAWLDDWRMERPDSGAYLLVSGVHLVKWAWEARGSGWKPKNIGLFFERLETARRDLGLAARARPEDPLPWAWMIYAGKGLQLDKPELHAMLEHARRRARHHRQAHSFMLDALAPKWGGSPEEMIGLARSAAATAPTGSTLPVVLAEAHLELAYNAERVEGKGAGARYFADPAVGEEVRRASARAFPPVVRETMDSHRCRVMFAFALWKTGQLDAAGEHLRAIGKSTPYGPFVSGLLFLSRDTVRRARRDCGLS